MNTPETSQQNETVGFIWKRRYTWVLLLNALYILLFYLLMKSFS